MIAGEKGRNTCFEYFSHGTAAEGWPDTGRWVTFDSVSMLLQGFALVNVDIRKSHLTFLRGKCRVDEVILHKLVPTLHWNQSL